MGATPQKAIFRAYQEQRRRRFNPRYLVYPALLLIGVLGYWVVSYHQETRPIRVETYRGLKTVHRGMSPQDVSPLLGEPIGKERRGNLECYQYGRPTLKAPSFTLHTVCYEDGKLREVSERRYNSWIVLEDGSVAPIEYDEPKPPASKSAPSLAGPNPP